MPRIRPAHLSWVMLLALVPMLSFMGHWPTSVPIPGTELYLSVPLAGAEHHDDHSAASEDEHAQHCHGGAASCSDVPAAAGVSMAALAGGSGFVIVSNVLIALLAAAWRPRNTNSLTPGLRPPRTLLSFS